MTSWNGQISKAPRCSSTGNIQCQDALLFLCICWLKGSLVADSSHVIKRSSINYSLTTNHQVQPNHHVWQNSAVLLRVCSLPGTCSLVTPNTTISNDQLIAILSWFSRCFPQSWIPVPFFCCLANMSIVCHSWWSNLQAYRSHQITSRQSVQNEIWWNHPEIPNWLINTSLNLKDYPGTCDFSGLKPIKTMIFVDGFTANF